MANIARSVESVDAATFFCLDNLQQPSVSPTILNNVDMPSGPLSKSDRQFFHYPRDAMRASAEESAADDFVVFILRMFNYDEPDRVVHQQKKITFVMAGQREEKHCINDPESPLIAGAVAAFYQNNLIRSRAGLPRLSSKVFPGITMIGTAPIFYRIPVSEELLTAVATAAYRLRLPSYRGARLRLQTQNYTCSEVSYPLSSSVIKSPSTRFASHHSPLKLRLAPFRQVDVDLKRRIGSPPNWHPTFLPFHHFSPHQFCVRSRSAWYDALVSQHKGPASDENVHPTEGHSTLDNVMESSETCYGDGRYEWRTQQAYLFHCVILTAVHCSDLSFSERGLIYDIGGSRTSRSAWLPYFNDAETSLFLVPIPYFDELLRRTFA
ncbi:hypothetical protein A0H81_14513 [Grifola frondosa]|uniref:Uncharacterized protein n=1 Tax=Grifola frondosa TaxID=5627 RepID=A0A1C7LN10_GRIFR|nr:hypothetical protein A0H81_14513 [Grifola frondosa]